VKLERLWKKAEGLIPQGIVFGDDPEYEEVRRSIEIILDYLPKIDGWEPKIILLELNEIAQWRLDAHEFGEPEAIFSIESAIAEPGRQIREYRSRFNQKRRALVRSRVQELEGMIDRLIVEVGNCVENDDPHNKHLEGSDWEKLRTYVAEMDTLLGSSIKRPEKWLDFRRHLGFAMVCDYRDIRKRDWPSVKADLQHSLYGEDEPLPATVEDLGELVAQQPSGPVPTKLNW